MIELSKKINILKGLGIVAVVLGHCGFPYTSFIYLYHMSLFFFITGYLYNKEHEKSPLKYIKKKFKSLYLPFIFFEIVFVLLRNFFIYIHIYDKNILPPISTPQDFFNILKDILAFQYSNDSMLGAIWFLKSLFFVSILYLLINIIFNKLFPSNEPIKFILITSLAIISFYTISKGYNPIVYFRITNTRIESFLLNLIDSRNFLLLSICYYGTCYRKYENKIKLNSNLAFFLTIILLLISTEIIIDVSHYNFFNPIFFILISLSGIYINLCLANFLINFQCKYLNLFGENSLYIMIFHFLSFKFVDVILIKFSNTSIDFLTSYPIYKYGSMYWILYSIAGLFLPLYLSIFVKNTKKYFLSLRSKNLIKN